MAHFPPGILTRYGPSAPRAVRPGALGRDRDVDDVARRDRRRGPVRRTRRGRDPRPHVARTRQPDTREQLLGCDAPRRATFPGRGIRVALQHRVHRRRHAVEAAEQHDLAVEIVGFDAAGAPAQALPRRSAAARRAADRARPQRSPRRSRPLLRRRLRCPPPRSTAAPSARARRASLAHSFAGPHSASTELARFISSFVYFHRMMSARGTDSNVERSSAAAIATARSSTPAG